MKTADDVLKTDLDYIVRKAGDELEQLSGRRLLVAGGAGFLGYYLVQGALSWNSAHPSKPPIHVTVLDNFVRGVPDWLTGLTGNPDLRIVEHDISFPIPESCRDTDCVVHGASIASPIYYRQYPIQTMDANVNGLRLLLDYCLQKSKTSSPVVHALFFSSSEIYGDPTPENIPTPETYRGYVSCTGPRACYDESKRYGETLCVNFARQYGIPIASARPFNNYGPGLKISDRRVIPDFARDIFSGRDIVMLSDGLAKRTFCYVADAVVGYFKVLVKGKPGEAYNVGVETPEISMNELAERLIGLGRELFDYRGSLIRKVSEDRDYLADNPARRCPVITKARSELGYDPEVQLDEGLRRSMLWYAGHRVGSDA